MEPTNESFLIEVHDDGVYMKLLPQEEGRMQPEAGRILDCLEAKRIVGYDRAAVEDAVRRRETSPVRVAGPQEVRPEPEISVIVSRDRMEAFLQVDLPDGAVSPDADTVWGKIRQAGVVAGVIPESAAASLRQPGLRVVCARGIPPENGADARIESRVDLSQRGKPAETADGGVNFKDLGLYINVEKGQVLAVKIPATPGTPGTDVCGNALPPRPGRDQAFHFGANIHVEDDSRLVASAGGNLGMLGDKMSISPVLQIRSDIDLSTGNIDFAGDVVIQGSVQEGFTVHAGGNVDISGMVSGGSVKGANITVRQGIIGLNRTEISASGSIAAKFVENARVTADQDILITDVVLHSHLSSGRRIRVEGRRGQIVGGVAAAAEEITAKSAGSTSSIPTELQVGVNPKLRAEYLSLRKDLRTAESSLDQIQKGLFTLKSLDPAQMTPEKKELQLKITRAQFTTMGQVDAMKKRMAVLETAFDELRGGQIKISDYVYPGVKIVVGALVKPVQQEHRFVVFFAEAGEIKFRPYK